MTATARNSSAGMAYLLSFSMPLFTPSTMTSTTRMQKMNVQATGSESLVMNCPKNVGAPLASVAESTSEPPRAYSTMYLVIQPPMVQ